MQVWQLQTPFHPEWFNSVIEQHLHEMEIKR